MSGLEAWKAHSTFEVTLPSGTKVKARYRSMELMLLSGNVDMAVMKELQDQSDTKLDDMDPEQRKRLFSEGVKLQRAIVKIHTLEVEGEPVHLTEDDLDLLPEEDLTQLSRYIAREDPIPLAPAHSLETLPDSPSPNGHADTSPSVTVSASIPQDP